MSIRPGQAKGPWVGSVIDATEVTGGANVGTGTGEVFRDVVAHVMNFRTLLQGAGITIVTAGDEITISSSVVSDNYWLAPILSIFDNTAALPVAPVAGDRYIALVTANGWTQDHVYEWDGVSAWTDTTPLSGMVLIDLNTDAVYQYQGGAWTIFQGSGTLDYLTRFTDAYGNVADSIVNQDATAACVGISTVLPDVTAKLHISKAAVVSQIFENTIDTGSGVYPLSVGKLIARCYNDDTPEALVDVATLELGAYDAANPYGTGFFRLRMSNTDSSLASAVYAYARSGNKPLIGFATESPTANPSFIADFRGDVCIGADAGRIYTQANSISSNYLNDTDGDVLYLNSYGYQSGSTRFRNTIIRGGKVNDILLVSGEYHNVTIGLIGTADSTGLVTLYSDNTIPTTKQCTANVGPEDATTGTFTRGGAVFTREDSGTLTDDGVLPIVASTDVADYAYGTGYVAASGGYSDAVHSMMFSFDRYGVQVCNGIGSIDTNDVDDKLCLFFDGSGDLVIKNRLGTTYNVSYWIKYFNNPVIA